MARGVRTMTRAFRIALALQAVWFSIKLELLSEQSEKVTRGVCGRERKENIPLRVSNPGSPPVKPFIFSCLHCSPRVDG